VGPAALDAMISRLNGLVERDARVLVGPETGDDAGVYLQDGRAIIATVDFITPVCDDPRRFGRVAAANSLSDVFAMGGRPLCALNLCCFPKDVPHEALAEILRGALDALQTAGAALIGGHTVEDKELKFGLAVIGEADPDRLLTIAGARPGDHLVLSKPVGTGVMINAFKGDKLDAAALEPALVEMERLNADASRLALEQSAHACTDITGFGLVGHALNMARASSVGMHIAFGRVPVFDGFYAGVAQGVSTGSTGPNRDNAKGALTVQADLSDAQQELLFDPQTSGGLLVSLAAEHAPGLVNALTASGHRAADIGEVLEGPTAITIV
jgi:selenide,water dikinase